MSLCECDCGLEANPHRRFIKNHSGNSHIGYHHSKETKQKISLGNKGKYVSEETKLKISIATKGHAATKGFSGHQHTFESKQKISAALINKTRSEETKQKMKAMHKGFTGKHHLNSAKQKISIAQCAEKSPHWKGGISFLPYCEKFNRKLKEAVKERDNHTCQLCSVKNTKFIVHHIHYDKENCYPDLITLCRSDNGRVNFNRKHYEELFMNKLNDRGLLFWTKFHQYP